MGARRVSKSLLCSTVSILTLVIASAEVRAADVPLRSPMIAKEPADTLSVWAEGGGFITQGGPVYFAAGGDGGPDADTPLGEPIKPPLGWAFALGLDYKFGATPWHVSAQVRYGQSNRSKAFERFATIDEESVPADGEVTHRERHWLADFAVGREVGLFRFLGDHAQTQIKAGLRIAEIRAKTRGSGAFIPDPGDTISFLFDQTSRFIGAGPRIGLEGTVPLGNGWAIDWLTGVSVLYGIRTFDARVIPPPPLPEPGDVPGPSPAFFGFTTLTSTDVAVVPNVDAQFGLSYWFTPFAKVTASYRFDGYWGALKTFAADGNVVDVNRFYHGVMLRLTMNAGGLPGAPQAGGMVYKAQPVVAPAYNWTGLYVGAHVGAGWGSRPWIDVGDDSSDNQTYDVSGFLGGFQVGYNYQFHPSFVVGIEADWSWANINGSGIPLLEAEATRVESKISRISTLTGRIGYAADQWLFYVKGGAAWSTETHTATEYAEGELLSIAAKTNNHGWTIGAGIEYGFLQNWSARLEYNYLDFGSKRFILEPNNDCFDGCPTPDNEAKMNIHAIKLGLNYRFNDFGKAPVVTKY